MARASTPEEAIRIGRMTALQKSTGSVRGIVAGDTIRRLLSRTIAQQIRTKVTAPFQYALSTAQGVSALPMRSRAMTDAPRCTVLVPHMEGGDGVLPFICGRILKEWSTKFCKERTGNRAIL